MHSWDVAGEALTYGGADLYEVHFGTLMYSRSNSMAPKVERSVLSAKLAWRCTFFKIAQWQGAVSGPSAIPKLVLGESGVRIRSWWGSEFTATSFMTRVHETEEADRKMSDRWSESNLGTYSIGSAQDRQDLVWEKGRGLELLITSASVRVWLCVQESVFLFVVLSVCVCFSYGCFAVTFKTDWTKGLNACQAKDPKKAVKDGPPTVSIL